MKRSLLRAVVVIAAPALALVVAAPAVAHMHRTVGRLETTVGWVEEPAYAGFRNAVQLQIQRVPAGAEDDHVEGEDDHAEGTPIADATLQVEVIFGGPDGTEKTEPMELAPAFGVPGEYRAYLIPTEPGTYTFRIFGTIGDVEFDQVYTSGEEGPLEGDTGQYNDMRAPNDVQFPAKPGSNTDLDEKITTESAKLAAAADDADSAAGTALILAILGVVLGALALVLSLVRGRKAAG